MISSAARAAALLLLILLSAGCAEQPSSEVPEGGAEAAIEVESLGHALGSPDAPVTVIEFSDFGCGYCAQFGLETFPLLRGEFVETGRVRWIYVPFVLGIFPNGTEAARAAECAGEQGAFWAMHDALFLEQRAWKQTDDPEGTFRRIAQRAGVDVPRFATCYEEARPDDTIELNNQVAAQLGVRSTPTFLVNGRAVEGALPADRFRQLIELAEVASSPGAAGR